MNREERILARRKVLEERASTRINASKAMERTTQVVQKTQGCGCKREKR